MLIFRIRTFYTAGVSEHFPFKSSMNFLSFAPYRAGACQNSRHA
jgi:hypothetical protein